MPGSFVFRKEKTMQIRTGIVLGLGIGIGTVIGMGINEDTKIKLANEVKKKIIFALTGEEWKPKKPLENVANKAKYHKFYEEKRKELFSENLLKFDDINSADTTLDMMKDIAEIYGVISVHELAGLRTMSVGYEWDKYGWSEEDLKNAYVRKVIDLAPELEVKDYYRIFGIGKPHIIDHKWKEE